MIRPALFASILVACGGNSPPASTPPKANAAVVNGCNGGDYGDHTTEPEATIKWDESITESFDRCIKVKQGQTVVFAGDFAAHPLEVSGGDDNNPLANVKERITHPGTPEERVPTPFKTTGVFGYKCSKHPKMAGAILVVP